MTVGIAMRMGIEVAYATFCAVRNQIPFVIGMMDGVRGIDTRRPATRRAAAGPPIPLNTPIDRLARWLGG